MLSARDWTITVIYICSVQWIYTELNNLAKHLSMAHCFWNSGLVG